MKTLTIKNLPEYANDYEFVVVRKIDDYFWFWGAYAEGYKAERIARDIDGLIVHNVRIQGKR